MTEEQWQRIQEIMVNFRPGGNYHLRPSSVVAAHEPATQKQINYLRLLRYKGPTENLNKWEACQLIADLLKEKQEPR